MSRETVTHPIHDHLVQMSAEDEVEHLYAGCDAGYCTCAPGILAAVVRAVITEHVCSCWGCTDYPCQTIAGVAEARGLDVEAMS